ncbi:glycosyltransferase family 4 protein [Acuticoccus kandeliae]|uniref:glycosyltransferase family 4 protein n=1 Tax=Acuticoccus kandeliae TaxID=2073160 RepID=UPI000D3E4E9C|nr:glycosyltransferase family 4 protein [Acuticoccus kandeliae]
MTDCIVFWQRMLTPHITELARELAQQGVEVYYVAEEALSDERRAMGWEAGDLAGVQVHVVTTPAEARDLVDSLPATAVHITQGVRSNGLVADAQKRIMALGRRHYPIMEKVDLRGRLGRIRPLVYAARFRVLAGGIEGLLAIGEGTAEWIARRAPRKLCIFPFAYFLKGRASGAPIGTGICTKFIFVGSLVELKRVDLLLAALATLTDRPFELEIVGDGPERSELEQLAAATLPGRVAFVGTLGMDAAIERIASADCLALPSDKDGWGAVVSEAQINGTPAICSSECGACGTVRASGFGGVFEAGDVDDLRQKLSAQLDRGPVGTADRDRLAAWAQGLTAEAGAGYLLEILRDGGRGGDDIVAPWQRGAGSGGGPA